MRRGELATVEESEGEPRTGSLLAPRQPVVLRPEEPLRHLVRNIGDANTWSFLERGSGSKTGPTDRPTEAPPESPTMDMLYAMTNSLAPVSPSERNTLPVMLPPAAPPEASWPPDDQSETKEDELAKSFEGEHTERSTAHGLWNRETSRYRRQASRYLARHFF